MSKIPTSECPNCGSIWSPGTEEHDWQQCSACGWHPGMPIEEDDDDDYFPDEYDEYLDDDEDQYEMDGITLPPKLKVLK